MSNGKYIIYVDPASDEETPIIFPFWLSHASVARLHNHQPVSAGFVYLNGEVVVAYGRSDILKLDSRPDEDSRLIQRMLRK